MTLMFRPFGIAALLLAAGTSFASAGHPAGASTGLHAPKAITIQLTPGGGRVFNPPGSCIGASCRELGGGRVFRETPVPTYKPGYIYRDSDIPTYRRPPAYGRNVQRIHTQWCRDRYRSYRSSDNTYKPRGLPRQECKSPYY